MITRNIAGTLAVGAAVYLFRNPKALERLKSQFQSYMSKKNTSAVEQEKNANLEQGFETLAKEGALSKSSTIRTNDTFTNSKDMKIGEDPYPKITTSSSQ
ncbi:response regulator of citrate/malate metabolism [Peribacillus deserti]|uniref:Response regulator of citrate/malate metabolism n=1 Tax=Peribacillus deserti TaxID=673318 RepID=A0ABS2QDP1_9BACI|nr:hypothetical protein [Peribacillus deserti]MBM7691292.1 response regulator of citrate/malate metabolism [Peribacillus deserti]